MSERRYERFASVPSPRVMRDERMRGRHLLLALLLVDAADRRSRVVELSLSDLKADRRWPWSREWARKTLYDLRDWDFIAFDVAERQRTPWRITLTGLWLADLTANADAPTANDSHPESWQTTANGSTANSDAAPHLERDSEAVRLPTQQPESPSTSKPISEVEYDHLLGEGAGNEQHERLMSALAEVESEKTDSAAALDRARRADARRKTREWVESLSDDGERSVVAELVETFDAVLVEERSP